MINLLILGGSGSGKSYVAGLLAEQLIRLGYSICVLDPEGDHAQLASLHGTLLAGGKDPLPDQARLERLLRHRFGSLVLDLSQLSLPAKAAYVQQSLRELQQLRERIGLPHWILVDEAHLAGGLAASTAWRRSRWRSWGCGSRTARS